MSLILDALNKADRERDPRDSVPDINTIHGGIRRPADQRRLVWIAGGLGAVAIILAILVLALWLRQTVPQPALEPKPVPTSPAPAPIHLPASNLQPPADSQPQNNSQPQNISQTPAATPPPLQSSAPPSDDPSVAVSPEVQALYGVQTDPVVQQVVEPEVRAAPQIIVPEIPRQTTVDEALAATLWEKSKRQPLPQPVQRPATPAKKVVTPPPLDLDVPVEETMAGYGDTPFLHELPVTVQDTIPTLMYAKHDYENRKVVINKTELGMGDATNGGVLVEQVLADGVLLSFNGTEFKLTSLSSWVNY